jgi:ankyrin repeat protein
MNGYAGIVRLLTDNGAGIDLKNDSGMTALMLASQNQNAGIVKILLEKGANMDLKDNEGKAAIDYAVNPEVRRLLSN